MTRKKETTKSVGRPRSEAKRSAILDAAGTLFLTHGPGGTSMDAVASAAKVSKQTVYSHFGGKEALFAACVENKVSTYRLSDLPDLAQLSLHDALTEIGGRFLDLMMDSHVVSMFRVVIGASASHPELGALFYRSGPERTVNALAGLLDRYATRGAFPAQDTREAAALFTDMLAATLQRRVLLQVGKPPGKAARRRHIARTVERFLRLYQADAVKP